MGTFDINSYDNHYVRYSASMSEVFALALKDLPPNSTDKIKITNKNTRESRVFNAVDFANLKFVEKSANGEIFYVVNYKSLMINKIVRAPRKRKKA